MTPAAVAAQPTTELATNVVPAVTVVPPLVLVEPAPPSAPAENKKFYNSFIKNRLEIGTRILHGSLLDDTRGQPFNGSFVGSVTMLRDNQDLLPTRFYVQYKILDYLGVGVSYDKISAAAGDWGIEGDGTGGSDGDVNLSGPLFYLLGCYPNSTKFTPFCEAGMGVYSAKFDADAAWGSTNDKRFELNSTKGIYFGAGCDFEVTDHFSVNAYGRYMKIDDVTGDYMLLGNKQSDIIFTMSYMAFGIGAKYAF